jgi:alkylated DNA nucleotide flippase Atl1
MISYYISGMKYDQKRTQDPTFIDKVNIRQRTFNRDTGTYETTQGNAFTVERLMPVPYQLSITVDIWASSINQKLEIFEQLGVLFNPSIDIQSTDNFIDWTSLSVVYQDDLNWTSRSVPQGSSNNIDVLTWRFSMPIWISSPIKVKKLGMIQKVIASIYKGAALVDMQNDSLLLGTRQKITPYGYQLLLVGNQLQILPASMPIDDNVDEADQSSHNIYGPDTAVYWHSVLNAYGTIRPGVSQIVLENEYMATEIVGTIDYNSDDDRILIYTIDTGTIPSNTLTSVDMIIDPNVKYPNNAHAPSNTLPAAAVGQRYLLVDDISQQRVYTTGTVTAWQGLTRGARANDIIQYGSSTYSVFTSGTQALGTTTLTLNDVGDIDIGYQVKDKVSGTLLGLVTTVLYDSNQIIINTATTAAISNGVELSIVGTGWYVDYTPGTSVEYVTNTTSGIQYRINDGVWRKSYDGYYPQGDWRIVI